MSNNPDTTNQPNTGKNWEEIISREEQEPLEALEATTGTIPELSEELAVAQTEAKKNYELFLRTQADFENAKRRAQMDIENAHKFGIKRLVEELVPVLDSLEQGLQINSENGNEAVKQLHAGMELTYAMLLNTVKKYGVEQINPEGQPFNPALHEAMSMAEASGITKDTVMTVFQKGYLLHGRLLRPARVIVAK